MPALLQVAERPLGIWTSSEPREKGLLPLNTVPSEKSICTFNLTFGDDGLIASETCGNASGDLVLENQ